MNPSRALREARVPPITSAIPGDWSGKDAPRRAFSRYQSRSRHETKIARRDGRLVAPLACDTCGGDGFEFCGATDDPHNGIRAHHFDYARPLDVLWLCRSCHSQWHGAADAELRRMPARSRAALIRRVICYVRNMNGRAQRGRPVAGTARRVAL